MDPSLRIHIVAGALGLGTGAVALLVAKGGTAHRRAGALFIVAMSAMAVTGILLASLRREEGSILGGALAAYLVLTLWPDDRSPAWVHRTTVLAGAGISAASGLLALWMRSLGERSRDGIPLGMFVVFASISALAAFGDLRLAWGVHLSRTARLRRHLWRACFALFLASASFFLGQAHVFPAALRVPALLAVPAFVPLPVMVYWLWRVRRRALPTTSPAIQGRPTTPAGMRPSDG